MTKQLILITEVEQSLKNGIVCYRTDDIDSSHFFYTKNKNLIDHFTNGFTVELNKNEVYDILNNKTLELKTAMFAGEVYEIATCFEPEDSLILKDSSLYIGNKTGAVLISDKTFSKHEKCSLSDFGILIDDKYEILKACVGILKTENDNDNDTIEVIEVLEDIYLVKGSV